jgi:hypothetical protein
MGRDRESKHASIDSWLDLARLIDELARQRTSWIFRGEPASTYELRPTAGRESPDEKVARILEYDIEAERAALRRFRHDAQPFVGQRTYSDLEWLALAQHHGMATRLLDWTESLLVAAFFAVEHAAANEHASIYGVSGLPVLDPEHEHDPFAVEQISIYRPRHINARISAQRSVFTVHPDPTAPFEPTDMRRWTVSRDARRDLKTVLDACSINYATLFPDLHGLARDAGWRYKWGLAQEPVE